MATKILTVKPGGKIRRRILKKTTDQRIKELRRQLGLDERWERLRMELSLLQ